MKKKKYFLRKEERSVSLVLPRETAAEELATRPSEEEEQHTAAEELTSLPAACQESTEAEGVSPSPASL